MGQCLNLNFWRTCVAAVWHEITSVENHHLKIKGLLSCVFVELSDLIGGQKIAFSTVLDGTEKDFFAKALNVIVQVPDSISRPYRIYGAVTTAFNSSNLAGEKSPHFGPIKGVGTFSKERIPKLKINSIPDLFPLSQEYFSILTHCSTIGRKTLEELQNAKKKLCALESSSFTSVIPFASAKKPFVPKICKVTTAVAETIGWFRGSAAWFAISICLMCQSSLQANPTATVISKTIPTITHISPRLSFDFSFLNPVMSMFSYRFSSVETYSIQRPIKTQTPPIAANPKIKISERNQDKVSESTIEIIYDLIAFVPLQFSCGLLNI
jgi:hypothetical protein